MKIRKRVTKMLRSLFSTLTERTTYTRLLYGLSSSGIQVTLDRAMALAVYSRCVQILAGDIGSLSLKLYRRRGDGGKEEAVDHPDYRIWHLAPNRYMTRQRWIEGLMGHLLTGGNHYAEIVRTANGGGLVGLYPITPGDIRPIGLVGDQVAYEYQHPTRGLLYPAPDRVFHVRGFSLDGICGLSPVKQLRHTLGLAIAAEGFGASLFNHGATPKGVLEYPSVLDDEDFEAIRASWERNLQGEDNWNRVTILDRGIKWNSTGLSADDAQFLETRRFQRAELGGWFGIPLHRLGDLEKATQNNTENMGIEYVVYTLTPWLVRIEQEINLAFYPDGEYFVAFNVASLLRGDAAARAAYYKEMFYLGAYSVNDILAMENRNGIGPEGDVHWMQLNLAPIAEAMKPLAQRKTVTGGGGEGGTRALAAPSLEPVLLDAAKRVTRKETKALQAAIEKHLEHRDDPKAFCDWAERFYQEQRAYFLGELREAATAAGLADRLEPAADQYLAEARREISDRLLEPAKLRDLAAGWDGTRPAAIVASLNQ